MTFSTFRERLRKHFEGEKAAPVMIDDGTFTLNIIGIGGKDSNILLWIADLHIEEGVNRTTEKNGLYTITLDENGAQISCSLNEKDAHQKTHMFSAGSYQGLSFNQKSWMVLFPNKS